MKISGVAKSTAGHVDDEIVHEEARQALSMFLLNEPTNDNLLV